MVHIKFESHCSSLQTSYGAFQVVRILRPRQDDAELWDSDLSPPIPKETLRDEYDYRYDAPMKEEE